MNTNIITLTFIWRHCLYLYYSNILHILTLSVINRVSRLKIANFYCMYFLGDVAHPALGVLSLFPRTYRGLAIPQSRGLAVSPFITPVRPTRSAALGDRRMRSSFLSILKEASEQNDRNGAAEALHSLFDELGDTVLELWMHERQIDLDDVVQDFIAQHLYPAKKDWREKIQSLCSRCSSDNHLKGVCRSNCRKIAKEMLYKSDPGEKKLRSLRDQIHKEALSQAEIFVVGTESHWPVSLCIWDGGCVEDFPPDLKNLPFPPEANAILPAPLAMQTISNPKEPYPSAQLTERMHWTLDVVKHRMRGSLLSRYIWEYFCKSDHAPLRSLDAPSLQNESETGLVDQLEGRVFWDSRIYWYRDLAHEAWEKLDSKEQNVFLLHTLAEQMSDGDPDATVRTAADAIGASHQTVYNIDKHIKEKMRAYCAANVFEGEEQYFAQALLSEAIARREKNGVSQSLQK